MDKGISNTIGIANMISRDSKFVIRINEKFKKYLPVKKRNVRYTPPNLNQEKYSELLIQSDVILIPYDHKSYKYRTSGVFLESISARKLTLVSGDTWMAEELKKNSLQKLIINDWSNENFLSLIIDIFNDKKINFLLKKMQLNYLKIHGPRPFVKKMKNIILK